METKLDGDLDVVFGDLLDVYEPVPENAFTLQEFVDAVKERSGATISDRKAERDLMRLVTDGKLTTRVAYGDGRSRRYYWRVDE